MKKQNVYDLVNTDSGYAWYNMTNETGRFFHCHTEYEIMYFILGDVDIHIEGRSYTPTPESLLLIPPNNMHGFIVKSAHLFKRVTFHFFPEILEPEERNLLLKPFQAPARYFPDLRGIHINSLVEDLKDCKDIEAPLQKIKFKHRLISMLADIYQLYTCAAIHAAPGDERINSVLQYLNKNIKEDISLEQLSKKYFIDKDHLNKLFSKEIGIPVHRYVQVKRLILARDEIRKGSGIEEAAFKAGFKDYSNFYRAYRSFFGIKPSSQHNEDKDFPV
ncbi:MAG: AraC family transcriptional regulator [Treponema sp.]|jgi:AraC-like DNA-binding protein|nr:AraC family transcriptional regulator [Treponema sp.]